MEATFSFNPVHLVLAKWNGQCRKWLLFPLELTTHCFFSPGFLLSFCVPLRILLPLVTIAITVLFLMLHFFLSPIKKNSHTFHLENIDNKPGTIGRVHNEGCDCGNKDKRQSFLQWNSIFFLIFGRVRNFQLVSNHSLYGSLVEANTASGQAD